MNNYTDEILEISNNREIKGREQETLEKISKLLPILEENKEWKLVAKMHWEAHLTWQHIAMDEENKDREQGIENMRVHAEKARDVIEENNIEDMKGGAYRFLGRAETYAGKHDKAKEYYEMALQNYSGKNERSKLEVSGFLAETLIRLGNGKEGLDLGLKTYDEFNNSELGKKIKEDDYYT